MSPPSNREEFEYVDTKVRSNWADLAAAFP